MKSKVLKSLAAWLIVGAWAPAAQAAYTITLQEVGGNVVATGSGSLNLAALTYSFDLLAWPNSLRLDTATVSVGPPVGDGRFFTGITSFPGPLGSGGVANAASGSGSFVGFMFGGYLMVPLAYVSGAPLGDSETTFAGTSFAALGLTPGRYVWSWGDGVTADTFTVQVGAPPPPPPPPPTTVDPFAGLKAKVAAIPRVGTSLTDKLMLAETYFAVPDVTAGCSVMTSFLQQVRALAAKKFTDAQAAEFSADALGLMTAMGCD
jgi:hypothetical protein